MVFRTRVSLVLLLMMLIPAAPCVFAAIETNDYMALWVLIYIPLVCPLLFLIRYTIADGKLNVRTAPFGKGTDYDLKKLVSITPTRSWISSPASSLKRIALDFGCGAPLIISPAAQDTFIDEIKRINPNVVINM